MVPAFLRGKLSRQQENMEDILTSTVFGLLQYADPNEGLLAVLSRARYPDGNSVVLEAPIKTGKYEFWRWLESHTCIGAEPDVMIPLTDGNGRDYAVLIEAKYRSGKSTEAEDEELRPNDQLAREWDNFSLECERTQCIPLMIYLTADFAIPQEEMQDSLREFAAKRIDRHTLCPCSIAWLSWRDIATALRGASSPLLRDLLLLLKKLGLTYFSSVTPIRPLADLTWRMSPAARTFPWLLRPVSDLSWTFNRDQS